MMVRPQLHEEAGKVNENEVKQFYMSKSNIYLIINNDLISTPIIPINCFWFISFFFNLSLFIL